MAEPTTPHQTLVRSFTLVARLQSHALRRPLAQLGLHEGQALMLAELHREDGLSQVQLAARLRVEPPTVTHVVRGLEKAGFVDREPNPSDARSVRVRLTSRGASLEQALQRVWEEAAREVYGSLDGSERDSLETWFDQIVARTPSRLAG